MINKLFKFEGKILNGYIFKNLKPKFWMLQEIEVQGQGHF